MLASGMASGPPVPLAEDRRLASAEPVHRGPEVPRVCLGVDPVLDAGQEALHCLGVLPVERLEWVGISLQAHQILGFLGHLHFPFPLSLLGRSVQARYEKCSARRWICAIVGVDPGSRCVGLVWGAVGHHRVQVRSGGR